MTLRPLSSKPLHTGFEVFTAVAIKRSSPWDITLCSSVKINRRFEGKISHPSSGSKG
jgi:hypothetical protein